MMQAINTPGNNGRVNNSRNTIPKVSSNTAHFTTACPSDVNNPNLRNIRRSPNIIHSQPEYKDLSLIHQNCINIFFWNIQGIGSKLELDILQNTMSKYEVIFLFETMKLDSSKPPIQNYKYLHCERKYKHP
jgi:type III secretory pathway component EscU